jgi:hypothetical protein
MTARVRHSRRERAEWTLQLLHPRRDSMEFGRSLSVVVETMNAAVQHEFPSPPGKSVVAGTIRGSNPVRVKLRSFPQGARVGYLNRRDRGDWLQPFLVGELHEESGASRFNYRITTLGWVYSLPAFFLAGLGLLIASIVVFATGPASVAVPLLVIGMAFVVGSIFESLTVENEMSKEQLLLDWLAAVNTATDS